MTGFCEAKREIEVLRERISRLCEAVGNISASLDLDTALREVVEGARVLTGARHVAIATVDSVGRAGNFTRSGIADEEHRLLEERPDGPRLSARALEAGAEDYIVKPFSPTELTARIRPALRKRTGPDPFVLGAARIP